MKITVCTKFASADAKNTMHCLKQLIQCPTQVTRSTSTLIDHILASFPSRVSKKGVINLGLSDHQLIFCTHKICKLKTGGAHKYINFCSLKNYKVDDYKKGLGQLVFQNYKILDDINAAYSDFFKKIMTVVNKIVPLKTKRVKGNTQKWFDGKVLEKLNSRDKLSQKFKKSSLLIDKELYKKVKYEALKMIATKKASHFKKKPEKILEN